MVVSAPHLRPKSWSVVPPLRFSFCAFVGFLGFVGLAYEVIQYTYLSIYLSIYLSKKETSPKLDENFAVQCCTAKFVTTRRSGRGRACTHTHGKTS